MPTWRKEHEIARVSIHFFGMVTFVIAACALVGQYTHRPMMYGWGGSGQMSTPTAICMLLNGISWYLMSRGEARRGGDEHK